MSPELTPDNVKVFLAEHDADRISTIKESLRLYGLAGKMTVAVTLDETLTFLERQRPGELDANVFLLDPNLGDHFDYPGLGRELTEGLYSHYLKPFDAAADHYVAELKAVGLKDTFAEVLTTRPALHEAATARMRSEALLVGLASDSEEGLPRELAQVPRADYRTIGHLVYESVVPGQLRRPLAPQAA
jgi:hypothetical protein